MSIPGIKHKVIGLVSGGKDSTFNLLHCLVNGHELVALATLTPEAGIGLSLLHNRLLRLIDR
jgi:diphthine-ammonia ligase